MTLAATPLTFVRYVFVYGTLRKGEQRDINRLHPAPRWIGRASVAGVLHHLGSYPGLMLTGPGTVQGEVYAVTLELERVLDEIEEVWPQQTGEYTKRETMVQLEPEAGVGQPPQLRELACFLYEIAPERIQGKPVIALGDWVLHRTAAAKT
ncbi:gamma-glutamylcyclotransferase family protein [Polaromonas sp.]|uniref:gamma-glutamylcyclotransferase family protein n=1 Tax=Polaromonas sp. TaxID=1869339 RepID=UPI00326634B2